jgi:hypothetical protein
MRFIFVFIQLFFVLQAQTYLLTGRVTDKLKEALPFTTIYVKGTGIGTSCNENGYYSLKLLPGKYEVVFQLIGYTKHTATLNLVADKEYNVILGDETVSLREIEVNANENPADIIIRKAIKKRTYHLNQVGNYSCSSYIKGLQRLNHISKTTMKLIKIANKDIKDSSSLLGVVYLSESQSEYHYKAPSDYKEVMKSSKVSGNSRAFSFNQYRYLNYNFYENLITMRDVSNRPFVSPINDNAFIYYNYKLLGSFFEDGKEVNKIQVIPKRETDPVFNGIIYIQENSWRLTGIDVFLTKKNKINFVDTITVKQVFTPISGDSIWMPSSSNMGFSFTVFGFKGDGYFNTILYNYNLQPQYNKNFFKNDIVVIEKGANKKDSSYWAENRPIPLTELEIKDYRKKDSIAKITENPKYIDSVDRRKNKFKINNLINGYSYRKRNKQLVIEMPGITDAGIQYNTVEGLNISYQFNLTKSYNDLRSHRLNGKIRYGFSNQLPGGELDWRYLFNHNKVRSFGVSVKSIVEQYNNQSPITPLINSIYTLFLNDNYMKTFRETGAGIYYRTEITKGLNGRIDLKYIERQALANTTNLLILDDPKKLFTSNDPLHFTTDDSVFKKNNVLLLDLNFTIRFKQRYYNVTGNRYYAENRYPRIALLYRKAIPINISSADFDLLTLNIYDNINLGLIGVFKYNMKGGYYVRLKKIYYMDYKHFSGNQTIIANTDYLNSFKLLPYYGLSTKNWYAEFHTEHHFNGFIVNKIPLAKKLYIQEVVGFKALVNDRVDRYFEVNFALKNILRFVRLDYVMSFKENNQLGKGFLIGFSNEF